MKTTFLPALFLLCLVYSTVAQPDKIYFEEYGVLEGLPEEYVSSVIQDDQGFIWFTTQNGLVKYDGYDFEVFGKNRGGIKDGRLQLPNTGGGIMKGKKEKLWVGGILWYSGFASFNPRLGTFNNYLYDPQDSLSIPFPYAKPMLEDSQGNLWFNNYLVTSGRIDTLVLGRLEIKSGKINMYPFPIRNSTWFNIIQGVSSIVESTENQQIWLVDGLGSFREWNQQSDTFEIVPELIEIVAKKEDKILSVVPAPNERFLLNGQKGVYLWNPVERKVDKSYHYNPNAPNSLTNQNVFFSFTDTYGHLWVQQLPGTLTIIDPKENQFRQYTYGKEQLSFPIEPETFQVLSPLDQDSTGIWFRIYPALDYLYYKFKTQSFSYYDRSFNTSEKKLPFFTEGNSELMDHSGVLWLGFRPGLFKQQPKKSRMTLFKNLENEIFSLPSDSINYLFEDRKYRLWVGTRNGLSKFDKQKNNFKNFQHISFNKRSISNNNIIQITEDSLGQIWIATTNGLNQWDESAKSFKKFFHSQNEQNTIPSVLVDKRGRLWISVLNKGIFRLDPKKDEVFKKIIANDKTRNFELDDSIDKIFEDSRGNLWLGSTNIATGLYRYLEDKDSLIHYFPNSNEAYSLSDSKLSFIAEDIEGRLLIGTDFGGLNQYDYEKDQFISFREMGAVDGYGVGGNNQMWFTMYSGRGLATVDFDEKEIIYFDETTGLLHNDISMLVRVPIPSLQIAIDNYSQLYLPTQRGLSVFDPSTETYTNYFEKDGYQPYGKRNVSLKTSDGHIWIGGNHGLNRIDPEKLMQKDSTLPQVWITSVGIMDSVYSGLDGKIFEQSVSFTKKIKLEHWQRDLSFEFVALHYLDPVDNQYSWKLENYDDHWTKPSKERKASYTNLSPGTYTFRVRGSNADGVWNEEGASLQITIVPPWWGTWWAYGLYLAAFLGAVYFFYRFNLNRQLAQQEAIRIKELDAVKSRFYTNITHEFRTPLTVILGMTEQKDHPSAWQLIRRNAQKLLQLINQLLDLTKLDTGNLEPNYQQIEIVSFTQYIGESFQSLADKKYIRLMIYSEIKELTMDMDQEKYRQIISNLLSNAIKFTPESGKIVLHLLEKNGELVLKIKDNGIGIAETELPHIFDRFYQVDHTHSRQGEGTGIGLALVKELVELMEGSITVESEQGQGTTFEVRFPIRKLATTKVEAFDPISESPNWVPQTIVNENTADEELPKLLLIEDNPDVVIYIQSLLGEHYELQVAVNGEQGIEMALEQIPDIVISDVMMPKKDGFEVVETLKGDERSSHIPIILLTAKADLASKIAGLKRGADVYLPKPFNQEELLLQMKNLIEQRRKLQTRYQSMLPDQPGVDPALSPEDSFLQKIKNLVEADLTTGDLDINTLAYKAGMSRVQLFRKIKALIGKSPSIFVRSLRLQKAKTLLLTTDLNISEITYDVGFSNPAFFSRIFREEFGMSPTEMREAQK